MIAYWMLLAWECNDSPNILIWSSLNSINYTWMFQQVAPWQSWIGDSTKPEDSREVSSWKHSLLRTSGKKNTLTLPENERSHFWCNCNRSHRRNGHCVSFFVDGSENHWVVTANQILRVELDSHVLLQRHEPVAFLRVLSIDFKYIGK